MLIALIAVSAALVVFSALQILLGDTAKASIRRRVDTLGTESDLEGIHEVVLSEKKKQKRKKKHTIMVSRQFEDSLAMSGIKMSAQEYIMAWLLTTFGPILVLSLLGASGVTIVAVGLIGFAVPPIAVQRAKTMRTVLFNKQLGEALTVMGNCMRSGYSFQQALGSIANEMQPPISTEFARVVRELNYGVPLEDALNHMVSRVNNKDLDLLVSAVLTSTQVGANLSEILDIIADTVRDRIKLREEIRVLSAQGRMSGMIIGLLPVVVILFLMIVSPTYFSGFFTNPIGQLLLVISLFMEIIGFFLINRIADVRY